MPRISSACCLIVVRTPHAAKENGSTPSSYVRRIGNQEKKAAFSDLLDSDG